eukprot:TRINITY_DN11596_c0_g1_i1.p1 TRINITY_DN11596_c0_g1~~TRINITY_DN11596_c0_g1_i1.p1  ORF type:complete len:313 (-),score=77.49 TRINITY_DN11596_c0_g1_i1:83-1021(-)
MPVNVAKGFLSRLTGLLPTLGEGSICRRAVESLIEQLYKYVAQGGYLLSPKHHTARYTCEFNITQYGEDSMTDLNQYSKLERQESVKDILNLGFTAQLESEVTPHLPQELVGALKFQQENMAAAVSSQSGVNSLVTSRIPSRVMSRAASRMGTRNNSMTSLTDLDGALPDTLGQIQQVTESQEAVMSFFYTDQDNQVKVMEIFDVTETDPSLLVNDDLGVNYTDENLMFPPAKATSNPHSRHSSGPASLNRQRHSSDSAFIARTIPKDQKRKNSVEIPNFRVGDLTSDDEDMNTESFSDPEADWVQQNIHLA